MPLRRTAPPPWAIDRRRLLGQRIAHHRRNAGLSQEQLADRVGVERRTIQRYEAGSRDPRFTDLLLIAAALGGTVEDLVCEEGPPAPGSP
ncbi:helix-turn-helix transcriptional regulator [Streptomyces sp. MCL20-2]|uniref:helix-turn-helix transcriptional regulator n=1 Tax=Streptomyces sp. MCL20-2 TaxID=2967219 RepID=UPI0029661171|nr:helix-turn-helix transcriptional regulator [Streptomyces sp. MCL20-2]